MLMREGHQQCFGDSNAGPDQSDSEQYFTASYAGVCIVLAATLRAYTCYSLWISTQTHGLRSLQLAQIVLSNQSSILEGYESRSNFTTTSSASRIEGSMFENQVSTGKPQTITMSEQKQNATSNSAT